MHGAGRLGDADTRRTAEETDHGCGVNSCTLESVSLTITAEGFNMTRPLHALDDHELKMVRHRILMFSLHFLIDLIESEVAHGRGARLHWNTIAESKPNKLRACCKLHERIDTPVSMSQQNIPASLAPCFGCRRMSFIPRPNSLMRAPTSSRPLQNTNCCTHFQQNCAQRFAELRTSNQERRPPPKVLRRLRTHPAQSASTSISMKSFFTSTSYRISRNFVPNKYRTVRFSAMQYCNRGCTEHCVKRLALYCMTGRSEPEEHSNN